MGGEAIPQQGGLLAAQEAAQLAQDLDEGIGVVVAGGDVEGELGATTADAITDRSGHRRLLPVERVGQRRWLAAWRPGAAHVRGQAERAFVEEDQTGSAPLGVCRICGQRSLTQRSIAAWSRSAARRLGRCTVQPSRWRSSAHTCAGWWRTPVSRLMTSAIRSRVHSSPVNPFAVAPSAGPAQRWRAGYPTAVVRGRSVRGCAGHRCRRP
jgi:hypothetical protein